MVEAERLFQKALAIDPENTTALSGLAVTLGISVTFGWADNPEEALATALTAARRAVELDQNDAEAYASLAISNFRTHDLDAAVSACRRALDLNPNLATAEGWLAQFLSWRGEHEEALLHADRAARLSPRDPIYSWWCLARTAAAFGAGQTRKHGRESTSRQRRISRLRGDIWSQALHILVAWKRQPQRKKGCSGSCRTKICDWFAPAFPRSMPTVWSGLLTVCAKRECPSEQHESRLDKEAAA